MAKMKYLVIHCSDTSYNQKVTKDDIMMWHCGALKAANGTYTFMGEKNLSADAMKSKTLVLPSGTKIEAIKTNGRGWSKVGYSDLIQRDGTLINLNPYTFDDVIDSFEVTNGASGYNSVSRHVCLAGGWTREGNHTGKDAAGVLIKPEVLYTVAQLASLKKYIGMQREIVRDVLVVGHNQLTGLKNCPNFDVKEYLKTI